MDEAKIRRGLILLALHTNYPHPVRDAMLWTQLRAAYWGEDGPKAYGQDLAWLERTKLIGRQAQSVQGRQYTLYSITEDGVLVADHSIVNPGVQIGAEDGR